MKENNRIVLSFDLDNTIINNREGIVNSFNYALNKYKIPERDPLLIERMIGTPLHEMFTKITDFNPLTNTTTKVELIEWVNLGDTLAYTPTLNKYDGKWNNNPPTGGTGGFETRNPSGTGKGYFT